jgi:hypothetical protein
MTKRKVFFLMVLCIGVACQAQDPAYYLPTVAYRHSSYGDNSKIEYEYDPFGHITLEKVYQQNNAGEYVWQRTISRSFHQLPNGEFVKTEEEITDYQRYSAAYDGKGMKLWYQLDYNNPIDTEWKLSEREEAVLNENGIRTAIRVYNWQTEQMEISDKYAFDDQGRVIHIKIDSPASGWEWKEYRWNEDNQIIEYSYGMDNSSVTNTNIISVLNGQYVNPYSLYPESQGYSSLETSGDDYNLHRWYFNADIIVKNSYGTRQEKWETTINAEKNEITVSVSDGNIVDTYKTLITDEYGSYYHIEREGSEYVYSVKKEYNQYGSLILEDRFSPLYGYGAEIDYIYDRNYDSLGRPTTTAYYSSEWMEYEETYDAWTLINKPSGINEKKELQKFSIYPNPMIDFLTVENAGNSTITVSDITGHIIYKRERHKENTTLNTSSWKSGIYFVTIQNGNSRTTKKVIKK